MVRRRGRSGRERNGQVAIADAVIALVILTIASAVIYSSVASSISGRSESRQRADLKAVAYETAGLPLEASYPKVSYDNLTGQKNLELVNATGEELLVTYLEVLALSNRTGNKYDISGILKALRELYEMVLEGRSYAVNAHGDVHGAPVALLFSSEVKDGKDTITTTDGIPHPRVVVQKEVFVTYGSLVVDLYLWK